MVQPQNWNPPNPEVFIDSTFALVAVIGAIALLFDYTNGFHDAANSIATVVSTRVLSPARAAMRAAFFNFIAFFLGTHAVAKTVYSGLVDPKQVNEWVVLAGLIGAVTWNLITWYLGLPTSSSHALIGGYAGAAIANAGFRALIFNAKWPKGWLGTLSFIVISPSPARLAFDQGTQPSRIIVTSRETARPVLTDTPKKNMASFSRKLKGSLGTTSGRVIVRLLVQPGAGVAPGLVSVSGAFARGNENNLHQPDGQFYLGSGRSPGYAVVNLGAHYQVTKWIQFFAQVNNLFDRKYFTAAQLGPTGFTADGNFIARPFDAVDGEFPVQHATFYAPGAPRGAWGGVRIKF